MPLTLLIYPYYMCKTPKGRELLLPFIHALQAIGFCILTKRKDCTHFGIGMLLGVITINEVPAVLGKLERHRGTLKATARPTGGKVFHLASGNRDREQRTVIEILHYLLSIQYNIKKVNTLGSYYLLLL
jgi:hypothetical protein